MSAALRVGVIGCGGYATGAHAPALAREENVELVAVCGPRPPSVRRFVAAWKGRGKPREYHDAFQMLEREELDGVLIASPHGMHGEQVRAALAAGCHVLVEKPMTVSLKEADAVVEAARRSGRHVLVGYKTPYTGALRAVRRLLATEQCGPLRCVNGYMAQGWLALTAGTWRHDPELSGGGQFLDSGSHLVCSLLWALPGEWRHVSAIMADRGEAVDLDTVLIARFADDVLVSLAVGGCWQPEGTILHFCCAEGRIEMDGWRGAWARVHSKDGAPEPISDGPNIEPVAHFCAVLRGDCSPLVDAGHGRRQAAFTADVYRAARRCGAQKGCR